MCEEILSLVLVLGRPGSQVISDVLLGELVPHLCGFRRLGVQAGLHFSVVEKLRGELLTATVLTEVL